jgi:hypothetical protein
MNLYKVTATFNGKTIETQVGASSQKVAIREAALNLLPSDTAEVSFSCVLVKKRYVPRPYVPTPLTPEEKEAAIKAAMEATGRAASHGGSYNQKPFMMSQTLEKKSDTILMDPAKCEAYEVPCKAAATKLIEMKIKGAGRRIPSVTTATSG